MGPVVMQVAYPIVKARQTDRHRLAHKVFFAHEAQVKSCYGANCDKVGVITSSNLFSCHCNWRNTSLLCAVCTKSMKQRHNGQGTPDIPLCLSIASKKIKADEWKKSWEFLLTFFPAFVFFLFLHRCRTINLCLAYVCGPLLTRNWRVWTSGCMEKIRTKCN
jgi:hypothetical protein